ncbi:unnamed protein product [Cyclocybe aegerita]|uniref:Uncharacterized protein n=1 Tax=Cyclocybe aegerita TaxID=1973307 RepID=A0A8S0W0C2_CYCAE|nr:unnamed protein product [Cyclocybe aegerita]
MHQGHNIPWDIITSNFKFVREDKRFTPAFSGLASTDRPNSEQELAHFKRKFAKAIAIFSETERAKYPQQIPPPQSGLLFSNELRDKYPAYLDERNQRLEHWIKRAQSTHTDDNGNPYPPSYYTGEGDLADVVKVLLFENQMETLLMLAQHPDVPIHCLNYLSWGHHFGFSRIKESAVHAYMYFNCAEATNSLENGQYALPRSYSRLLQEISWGMDYPAQQIPHLNFLKACGVLDENGHYKAVKRNLDSHTRNWGEEVLVHKDYGRLKEYMKTLFEQMYRYDVLMRECGLDPKWEEEVGYSLPQKY